MTLPTKYKPEYCEAVVKHMEQGYSFETFGAIIDVGRTTLYEWVEVYPEFKKAKQIAMAKCQMWWEKTGHEGMFMGGKDTPFQAGMWNFNMSARFKWSQKVESKVDTTVTLEKLIGDSMTAIEDKTNADT